MPIQIGQPVHTFSEPTDLLSDCHRRIEMFLGILETAGAALERPLSEEVRRALTAALAYFREAAPKHTADEEESLFPRLRRSQDSAVQAALGQIEQLESEHRWADALHAEVDRLGQRSLADGCLSEGDADLFRSDISKLKAMYTQHISLEDKIVFPLADRVLSPPDRASMAREMAGRRNVSSTPKPLSSRE